MNNAASLVASSNLSFNRRKRLAILIGVCCVGFFLADVATPTCFTEPFPGMLAVGVVTAQLTVICVWGTLVRGTFWIRFPWTLLLLVVSWCGFAWGIRLRNGAPDLESLLATTLIWTFGFVTSFVPLKIAAMCFRWQIVQDCSYEQEIGRGARYAIRDMMIGMCLLAISMRIGLVLLPTEDISLTVALRTSGLNDLEPFVALTIYGVVSLLVKLPCIWISLGEKAERIGSRTGLWIVYCFGLSVIEIGLFTLILGSPAGREVELFSGIIVSHQLMGGIMLGVCLALRGLGYRLERSVSRRAENHADTEQNIGVV